MICITGGRRSNILTVGSHITLDSPCKQHAPVSTEADLSTRNAHHSISRRYRYSACQQTVNGIESRVGVGAGGGYAQLGERAHVDLYFRPIDAGISKIRGKSATVGVNLPLYVRPLCMIHRGID